jgi:hypothetical protein
MIHFSVELLVTGCFLFSSRGSREGAKSNKSKAVADMMSTNANPVSSDTANAGSTTAN